MEKQLILKLIDDTKVVLAELYKNLEEITHTENIELLEKYKNTYYQKGDKYFYISDINTKSCTATGICFYYTVLPDGNFKTDNWYCLEPFAESIEYLSDIKNDLVKISKSKFDKKYQKILNDLSKFK